MKNILSFLVLILLSGLNAAEIQAKQHQQAVSAAQEWLDLVENGQLHEGWEKLSSQYRNNVTQQKWEVVFNSLHVKSTKPINRTVLQVSQWKDHSTGSDEKYLMIRIKTTYDDQSERVQMVAPKLDDDGEWRVAGFYFR